MIEMDTRLRVALTKAKRPPRHSPQSTRPSHHASPTVSDGWGGIREAMVEVYGQVPEYQGTGRPPTRKQPMPGWQSLQVVKQRDEHGNLIDIDLRVIFGDEAEVLDLPGRSTAYVERTHLTMRHFNSRLTRKSLAFSKDFEMHCAAAAWEDLVCNLARPLKSLRLPETDHPTRRWRPQTPAMAAGLTDHIWPLRELLFTVPFPNS